MIIERAKGVVIRITIITMTTTIIIIYNNDDESENRKHSRFRDRLQIIYVCVWTLPG